MFFKGKKGDDSSLKKETKELIDEQKKVQSDIIYLESKYESVILKSLIMDFPEYKQTIEKVSFQVSPQMLSGKGIFWMIDRVENASFSLEKITDLEKMYSNRILIRIGHNGKIDNGFELRSIDITSMGKETKLSSLKFKDIIFKYIATYELVMSKRKLDSTKKSFEMISNILGKDVCRDSRIDEIIG